MMFVVMLVRLNMDTNNYSSYEQLSFRQIVLNYLRKIMDLNLKLINDDFNIEHTKTYRDGVLGLSDVLLPFYDDEMNKAYSKYEEDYKLVVKQTSENGIIKDNGKYITLNKKLHRELFRQLNLLLKRNDYLKENVYGEDKDELVSGDDGGEG